MNIKLLSGSNIIAQKPGFLSYPHLSRSMITLFVGSVCLNVQVLADDQYWSSWEAKSQQGVAVVNNSLYREECGSCHMPYSAGLLPPHSWEKIMTSLDDHFGENAEIAGSDWRDITNYLLNNAAGRVNYSVSNKMLTNVIGIPLRITSLPYFKHEHREIPQRLVTGNSQVGSFSNCDACHTQANNGSFDEHQVVIPGYGKFEG